MALDQNTSPYYNDYDETKKYYQIMFRPGYAVQARELTQLQSILQNQIERFGKHVFKEGSMVIPGGIALDKTYSFVKLQQPFDAVDINVNTFLNRKIVGTTSGAVATVQEVVDIEDSDPNTLYVIYNTGDSVNTFTGSITTASPSITNIDIDATTKLAIGAIITGTGIPETYSTDLIWAVPKTVCEIQAFLNLNP